MIIDTHCHLNTDDYSNLDEVINKMHNNIIIISGTDDESNRNVIKLVNKYANVYGTIGIHPEDIDSATEDSFRFIIDNITNPKIVGIGEVGLDYHWSKDNKEKQKEIFIRQINIANKYHKTLVIHSRDAIEDTYNILSSHLHTKAVLHCYNSSIEMAIKFLKFNIKFGVGGVITFKNAKNLQGVVKQMDLQNMVLETDSPYLTPEPYRGSRNEPYNIYLVAAKIAEIKGISVDEVTQITTLNAISQFDLPNNL